MSESKIRECKKCGMLFRTVTNYLSTCDLCLADTEIEKEGSNPFSVYTLLKKGWGIQEQKWGEQRAIERGVSLVKFWIEVFRVHPNMTWRKFRCLTYLININTDYMLSKEDFDILKKVAKNRKASLDLFSGLGACPIELFHF